MILNISNNYIKKNLQISKFKLKLAQRAAAGFTFQRYIMIFILKPINNSFQHQLCYFAHIQILTSIRFFRKNISDINKWHKFSKQEVRASFQTNIITKLEAKSLLYEGIRLKKQVKLFLKRNDIALI